MDGVLPDINASKNKSPEHVKAFEKMTKEMNNTDNGQTFINEPQTDEQQNNEPSVEYAENSDSK